VVVNIKTIKVSLSDKGLDDLISKLMLLKDGLEQADNKIVEEMADFVEQEVSKNLDTTPFKDGNEDARAYSIVNGNKAEAGMTGSQVLYDEFGTGTKGEKSPHPKKGDYNLKGYNTGPKIDPDTGVWWYYSNEKGKVVDTTGIPAGLQVFNASQELQKVKLDKIKEKVGEVISKL
jgi:hypothetical protein